MPLTNRPGMTTKSISRLLLNQNIRENKTTPNQLMDFKLGFDKVFIGSQPCKTAMEGPIYNASD
jgi:hypothetical protein